MKALVALASRHGATTGMAERIAQDLNEKGIPAQTRPGDDNRDVTAYDAVVLGSGTYLVHWLKEAARVRAHASGGTGCSTGTAAQQRAAGHRPRRRPGSRRADEQPPQEFDGLTELLGVPGARVFLGACDAEAAPIGVPERALRHLSGDKTMLPSGDVRDWTSIESWAGADRRGVVGDPAMRADLAGGPLSSPSSTTTSASTRVRNGGGWYDAGFMAGVSTFFTATARGGAAAGPGRARRVRSTTAADRQDRWERQAGEG